MKTAFEVVATRYEQITAKDGLPGAKPMTHKVRIVSESDQFVVGVIVNEEGDEIAPKGFDEKQWLIQKETITKRTPLRMDLDYGILVTAARRPYTSEDQAKFRDLYERMGVSPVGAGIMAEYQPIRMVKKNRQTGTTIILGRAPAKDIDGHGWITFCVDHENSCDHLTRSDAEGWVSSPLTWCEGCREDEDV